MNIGLIALILATSIVQTGTVARPPVRPRHQVLRVNSVFSLCASHPTAQKHLEVRGWFMPITSGSGYVDGGLFNDRHAVPVTTVNQWDVNGNWRTYRALFVHITTHASFGPRFLTLDGRIECSSYRFVTDRDPFPPLRLTTVYGTTKVGGTGPITAWASAGGLKLMLTLPRRSYPHNALAKVTVSIQNISRHTLGYWVPGESLPGVASPQAEVLNRSGKLVFPPAMPFMPALPGPAPFLAPLHPGQTIPETEYIVIRGTRIRASQSFTPRWPDNMQRPSSFLMTHPITVRLTRELPPHLLGHETTGGPVVDVLRPVGVTGRFLRLNYADCGPTDSGFRFSYSATWVGTSAHLTPGCAPLRAWHFRIAVLDHPVAAFDYTAPQPTPATPPPPSPTTAAPTATATPSAPSLRFADLLHRADRAMAAVHALHATGIRVSVDPSSRMSLHIQAACRSRSGAGIP